MRGGVWKFDKLMNKIGFHLSYAYKEKIGKILEIEKEKKHAEKKLENIKFNFQYTALFHKAFHIG